jgi:hypothetical protein
MKTKDWFSRVDLLRLRQQSTTLLLAAILCASNASGQTLTAPPNQTPPPGSNFSSINSNVVTANAGGTITLTGGTVTENAVSGGQVAGLLATGFQAKITATSVSIVNNNNQGSSITFGVDATSTPTGAATVTLSGGTIVTSELGVGRAYGINSGVGGTVDATGVALTTNSANSHAVVAAGGTVNLAGGSITTNGQFSLGLQANSNAGSASITVNGTTINTFGNTSSGADAEGSHAATISLTGATINTSGASANGLIAIGSGNTITAANTNITTTGPSAAGATAFIGGQIQVEGGTIKSTQGSTVVANSASLITLTGGTVTLNAASGGQVAGLLATGDQAKITGTNVSIVNNNDQGSSITFGVDATSTPTGAATVTLSGGTIVTSAPFGGRAYGINSAVGGVVNAMSVAITTNSALSHGVLAEGGTVNLSDGSITTLGRFSLGLQANSNTGPSTITANGTTITTSGDISSGAEVTGSGQSTISLSGVKINTSGANAPGALLDGSGSYTLNLNNTSITTLSSTSDAIVFGNAKLANVTINNSAINPGSGNLLNSVGSTGTLNIENSTLTGNILADSASTVDVNLLDNSTLTAVINGAHNVFIDPSTWITPNDSFITGDLTVQGRLIFAIAAKFAATGEASVLT